MLQIYSNYKFKYVTCFNFGFILGLVGAATYKSLVDQQEKEMKKRIENNIKTIFKINGIETGREIIGR